MHRADAGAFLLADAYGAARLIYVKDDTGTDHGRVSMAELRAEPAAERAGGRVVLDLLGTAKHLREIRVVNGLRPGAVADALGGADIGTLITA